MSPKMRLASNSRLLADALGLQLRRAHRAAKPERSVAPLSAPSGVSFADQIERRKAKMKRRCFLFVTTLCRLLWPKNRRFSAIALVSGIWLSAALATAQ